jgi:hypothetical protein
VANDPGADERLIQALRERAASPERRRDARPSQFQAGVQTLDLTQLLGAIGGAGNALNGVVESARTGRQDPSMGALAESLGRSMQTPVATAEIVPASDAEFDAAEAALGVRLPIILRRVYREVGNGGYGPGYGLLPLTAIVDTYRDLLRGDALPRGRTWPAKLVPLLGHDPAYDCVDTEIGTVIAWDPDGLSERSRQAAWDRSFTEVAASVEIWLDRWAHSRTVEEQMADRMAGTRVRMAREARASIAAKTPAERAAMGLPAVGWERVVWGGIGLDED